MTTRMRRSSSQRKAAFVLSSWIALLLGLLLLLLKIPTTEGFSAAVTATSGKTTTINTEPTPSLPPILQNFDYTKESKLPWAGPEGYMKWKWRNEQEVHYIELGRPSSSSSSKEEKPKLLLIHGFGASSYHFRYNLPILARDYHVFCFDLLGMGLSDKPIQPYGVQVWKEQALDFIEQVMMVKKEKQERVTIGGNSLGGYTALAAAADSTRGQDLINGCVLLNSAGQLARPPTNENNNNNNDDEMNDNPLQEWVGKNMDKAKSMMERLVIDASFLYTKQPLRIQQVLRKVYPTNPDMVDSDLVDSIQAPAQHVNAQEVFYRIITKNGSPPQPFVQDLLYQTTCPILLCWGDKDPWIGPDTAQAMMECMTTGNGATGDDDDDTDGSRCSLVSIDAGHCPHDENPKDVNEAIANFVESQVLGGSRASR